MCNERERLIDYVYEETDAAERVSLERHLATCAECRHEVAGLQAVRQDLLAWEVPDHESVWRPFVRPVIRPSWRDVPASALAAAAGLVLMVGMAGGVVAGAWVMPEPAPAPAAVAEVAAPAPVTGKDLAQLEARIRTELRTEMEQELTARVATLAEEHEAGAAHLAATPAPDVEATLAAFGRRLDRTDEFLSKQASWAAEVEDRTMRTWNAVGGIRAPATPTVMMPVNYGGEAGR